MHAASTSNMEKKDEMQRRSKTLRSPHDEDMKRINDTKKERRLCAVPGYERKRREFIGTTAALRAAKAKEEM